MADTTDVSDLERAKHVFLDAWRAQRIRDWDTGAMLRFDPRAFWSSVLAVLVAFRRTELCDTVTPHLVDELALLLEELLAGRVPDKVLPLLDAGAPSLRPVERRARVIAAAYVRFAQQGLIPDSAPVKTIREKFRIAPSTATLWVRTRDRGDPWLPSEKLPLDVQANSVALALNAVADEYARKGRGQAGRWKYPRLKRRRPRRGHNETP
jgi:hypothetical protein